MCVMSKGELEKLLFKMGLNDYVLAFIYRICRSNRYSASRDRHHQLGLQISSIQPGDYAATP